MWPAVSKRDSQFLFQIPITHWFSWFGREHNSMLESQWNIFHWDSSMELCSPQLINWLRNQKAHPQLISWTKSCLVWHLYYLHHWQPSGVYCRMKASSMLSHSVRSFATSAQFFILPRCFWISSAQRFWVRLNFIYIGRVSTLWGHAHSGCSCDPHVQPISVFVSLLLQRDS